LFEQAKACSTREAILMQHEVVTLPSFSALAALRQEDARCRPRKAANRGFSSTLSIHPRNLLSCKRRAYRLWLWPGSRVFPAQNETPERHVTSDAVYGNFDGRPDIPGVTAERFSFLASQGCIEY
jgi:hypothetical protein